MTLQSASTAQSGTSAMQVRPQAIVSGLYVGPAERLDAVPVDQIMVTYRGIVGDRHYGATRLSGGREELDYPRGTRIRNYRQVSIVSADEVLAIAEAMKVGRIDPGWLGANIVLEGIPDLTVIQPLTRLFFQGGAVIVVYALNIPCISMGKELIQHLPVGSIKASDFPRAAKMRRGVVGWVEFPGTGFIGLGEPVLVKPPTGKS